jgi:hypothetical protein
MLLYRLSQLNTIEHKTSYINQDDRSVRSSQSENWFEFKKPHPTLEFNSGSQHMSLQENASRSQHMGLQEKYFRVTTQGLVTYQSYAIAYKK